MLKFKHNLICLCLIEHILNCKSLLPLKDTIKSDPLSVVQKMDYY